MLVPVKQMKKKSLSWDYKLTLQLTTDGRRRFTKSLQSLLKVWRSEPRRCHLGPKENEVHVVCCVHESLLDLQHLDVPNTFSPQLKTASHGETINIQDALKIWVMNWKT